MENRIQILEEKVEEIRYELAALQGHKEARDGSARARLQTLARVLDELLDASNIDPSTKIKLKEVLAEFV